MENKKSQWTKAELHTYVLLLCANADSDETPEEILFIREKTDSLTFEKIYEEFKADTEKESLEKIQDNLEHLEYSHMELSQFRQEIYEIFFSDCNFTRMEKNLDRILDNILY